MNAFGLPEHLRPFEGKSPQLLLVQSMYEGGFQDIYSVPYRRNTTLIACQQPKKQAGTFYSDFALNGVDNVITKLFSHRWRLADKINIPMEKIDGIEGSRNELNNEMEYRWPGFIKTLNTALINCGFHQIKPTEIRQLVLDQARSIAITEWLLERKLPESSFVPIFVGLAFTNLRELEWYPKWIIDQGDKLLNKDAKWFINVALWQLLSIMANPLSQFGNLLPMVQNLIKDLKLV